MNLFYIQDGLFLFCFEQWLFASPGLTEMDIISVQGSNDFLTMIEAQLENPI
jgi:hypothetical protein